MSIWLRHEITVNDIQNIAEQLDEQLVLRVQEGDKRAFDQLVIKYQHKIVQLVYRYVKDASEAEDIAQETFIKAYRAISSFRGESAFYTWLYRIGINTAKNYLMARSRRGAESEIDVMDAEQVDDSPQMHERETPEHLLLNEEILTVVNNAMEELPEEMREAITLRELEGMSYEEIAQIMACPIGTVRSRIFRAREAIDNKLKPLLD